MFFLGIVSIQYKIRRDRPTETGRSPGRSRSTCWQTLAYAICCIYDIKFGMLQVARMRYHCADGLMSLRTLERTLIIIYFKVVFFYE